MITSSFRVNYLLEVKKTILRFENWKKSLGVSSIKYGGFGSNSNSIFSFKICLNLDDIIVIVTKFPSFEL